MAKKMRVYELARELGLTNKEGLDLCLAMGIGVTSHSSSIEEAQADRVRRRAEREGLKRAHQPEEPAPEHDRPAPAAGRSSSPAPLQTPTSPLAGSPAASVPAGPQAETRGRPRRGGREHVRATGRGVACRRTPRPCPLARVLAPRLHGRLNGAVEGRERPGRRLAWARLAARRPPVPLPSSALPATSGYRRRPGSWPPPTTARLSGPPRQYGAASGPVRPSGRRQPRPRPRPAVRRPAVASAPAPLRWPRPPLLRRHRRHRRRPWRGRVRPALRPRECPGTSRSRCRRHPTPGSGARARLPARKTEGPCRP